MLALAGLTASAQETARPSSLLNGVQPLDAANDQAPAVSGSNVTEITATSEATFDQQSHKAVFTGNVRVKHPQFTLTSDKLTAFLKKEAVGGHAAAKPAEKTGTTSKNRELPGGGGGLEKVIAEGNVVIVQDRPAQAGGEPVHYVAKAARAEYESSTGNVTLSGWPQVAQGINMQVATEESTIMILNQDGKMTTSGGSKTLIQDTGKTETGKPTPHP